MLKKVMITMLSILLMASVAHAAGVGVFYVGGSGDSKIRIQDQPDAEADIEISGSGLVYDSNLAMDRLFNYRIGIGKGEYGDSDGAYEALVIFNDFGFGVARNRHGRFWIGPEVMITIVDDQKATARPKLFGMGMGLAMGGNVNVTEHFTFTVKVVYMSQTMAGRMTISPDRYDVNTDDTFIYTSFSLIYRFNEHF